MVRTIVLLESRGRFVAWSFRWSRIRQRIWRIVRIRGDENFIKDKSIFPHPEVDLVLARSSNFKTSGWIFKGCVGPDKAIFRDPAITDAITGGRQHAIQSHIYGIIRAHSWRAVPQATNPDVMCPGFNKLDFEIQM